MSGERKVTITREQRDWLAGVVDHDLDERDDCAACALVAAFDAAEPKPDERFAQIRDHLEHAFTYGFTNGAGSVGQALAIAQAAATGGGDAGS